MQIGLLRGGRAPCVVTCFYAKPGSNEVQPTFWFTSVIPAKLQIQMLGHAKTYIKHDDYALIVHIFTCTYSSWGKNYIDQVADTIQKTRFHANTRDNLKKCDWIGPYPKSKSGHRSHVDGYKWNHMCLNVRQVQKCEVTVCSPMLFHINPLLSAATGRHGGR